MKKLKTLPYRYRQDKAFCISSASLGAKTSFLCGLINGKIVTSGTTGELRISIRTIDDSWNNLITYITLVFIPNARLNALKDHERKWPKM